VVIDCLQAQGIHVSAIFDPQYSGELFGVPQRGVYNPEFATGARAIVAIGDNVTRKKVAGGTRHSFTNAIHPSVILSRYARIGTGNMILHGAIIQAQARIGDHCIVNTGSQVDHDCSVADFAHLGPGTVLCGTVSVGEGSFIGAGAIIIPGIRIGAWCIVGAGSVVIRDIPDYTVVAGNPARVIKQNRQ
jgi:sugar O-acyltransferase (sialic acid O-acetyltransferase NeuD family)